jgi:hypothetical protein
VAYSSRNIVTVALKGLIGWKIPLANFFKTHSIGPVLELHTTAQYSSRVISVHLNAFLTPRLTVLKDRQSIQYFVGHCIQITRNA